MVLLSVRRISVQPLGAVMLVADPPLTAIPAIRMSSTLPAGVATTRLGAAITAARSAKRCVAQRPDATEVATFAPVVPAVADT